LAKKGKQLAMTEGREPLTIMEGEHKGRAEAQKPRLSVPALDSSRIGLRPPDHGIL